MLFWRIKAGEMVCVIDVRDILSDAFAQVCDVYCSHVEESTPQTRAEKESLDFSYR